MLLLKLYKENTDLQKVKEVVETLRQGGLIIYPTDSVYAIGCDALNIRAVEKICKLKGVNPLKSNLSIACENLSQISEYAKVDNKTFKLLRSNLPGPFTFIVPTSSSLPKIYKKRKEVGVRIPNNSIALQIIRLLGNPMMTTSVNLNTTEPEYTTDPELLAETYATLVDLIINGGHGGTVPSTIVNCIDDNFEITRQGLKELSY